jgi:YD repeat-containing protein
MNSLTTQDQLTALNEQQTAFWIYKYNANGCRLSEQTRPFVLAAEATRDIAIREIDVQTHRPLALSVAELR